MEPKADNKPPTHHMQAVAEALEAGDQEAAAAAAAAAAAGRPPGHTLLYVRLDPAGEELL